MDSTSRSAYLHDLPINNRHLRPVYWLLRQPAKVLLDFLCVWESGEPHRDGNESLEVGWFGSEEALVMVEHPALRDRLRYMLEFSGRVVYRIYRTRPFEIVEESVI